MARKMQVAFQAKAAGIFRPEAKQRYIEDLKILRTPAWNAKCVFNLDYFFFFL
jgi:hypothetical protein